MVAGFLKLPGVAASEDGGSGWGAFGIGCEGVVEEDAFACDAVKCRGVDPGATISTGVGPGLIVGNAEEDVWALCHLGLSREIFWWIWWILVVLYYDIWVACANIGICEGK